MRIRMTKQMLNRTSRRTGVSSRGSSLLRSNSKSSNARGSSLLAKLGTRGISAAKSNNLKKNAYEKLEKSAEKLKKSSGALISTDDKLLDKVKTFVSDYNDILNEIDNASSTLNSFYKQMMLETTSENKDILKEAGITENRNGYLSLDEKKFNSAGTDILEKVFGKNGRYIDKINYIAGRVDSSAETDLKSLSNQYSSSGRGYSSYSNNKYNWWG